jgi:hypothetical protein
MNAIGFDRGLAQQALVESARLATLLEAIERTRLAKAKAQSDGLSEAAEYLAVQEFVTAEADLLNLVLEPRLSVLLTALHESLNDIAGDEQCA